MHAQGWCGAHYGRWLKTGDVGDVPIRPRGGAETREARFWSMVAKRKKNQCWFWLGHITAKGYGVFTERLSPDQPRVSRKAHQVAFEIEHGWSPERGSGLEIRHLCGNPSCVNVAHLAVGTARQNADDRRRHGRGGVLTYEHAEEIRARLATGELGRRLAEEYGVSESAISRVKHHKQHQSPT